MKNAGWLQQLMRECFERCALREQFNRPRRRRTIAQAIERLDRLIVLSGPQLPNYDVVAPQWFDAGSGELTATSGTPVAEDPATTAGGEWIVRLTADALTVASTLEQIPSLLDTSSLHFSVVQGLGLPGLVLVQATDGSAADVSATLANNPWVSYFEQNADVTATAVPNDPKYSEQTELQRIGATTAWSTQTTSTPLVIAVVDSGVDYTSPDLYLNIWLNQGEIPAALWPGLRDADGDGLVTFRDLNQSVNQAAVTDFNGTGYIDAGDLLQDSRWMDRVDGDGDGKVDDLIGWDFTGNDALPMDENGHGTHVSGILAATGNNGQGIAGVNWSAQIMVVRFLDQRLHGEMTDAVSALNYVTQLRQKYLSGQQYAPDVRISNNSWEIRPSQLSAAQSLNDAITANANTGMLLVAAAGNGIGDIPDNLDTDPFASLPAANPSPNIVSVAAVDSTDHLLYNSNYGLSTVDLAAPGLDILSTEPGGKYGTRTGTSMAAPFVSGTAALFWARFPQATAAEVKLALLSGVVAVPGLTDKVVAGGRLDIARTLGFDTVAPRASLTSAPDITTTGQTTETIIVNYTDNVLVDWDSLNDADLTITRADGQAFTGVVTQVSKSVTQDSPQITVTYRVSAPSGKWTNSDNGTYQVRWVPNQVADTIGNTNIASLLGTFRINIPAPDDFRVNSTADSVDSSIGDGQIADAQGRATLRAAIQEANADPDANTIKLPAGVYTLASTGANEDLAATGDLDLRHNVTIIGASASTTIIDGAALDRIFHILPGVTVTLQNLTIRNGLAADGKGGGGILNEGVLTLDRVLIANNRASTGGGGLMNNSASTGTTLTVTSSTFSNNTAQTADGGGAKILRGNATLLSSTFHINSASTSGGGLSVAAGTISATNVTLSANSAGTVGGGASVSGGAMALTNTTVTLNSAATAGGGLARSGSAVVPLVNTILAGNTLTSAGTDVDVTGAISAAGSKNNFIGIVGTATGFSSTRGDLIGTTGSPLNAQLAALGDYGGPTLTHRPNVGSPVIDKGAVVSGLNSDQRGLDRNVDGDNSGSTAPDIGAVEFVLFSSISGQLFYDLNQNGVFDTGEPPLAGWTVFLDSNANGILDSGERSTITGTDGTYLFTGVAPGTYAVAELLRDSSGATALSPIVQNIENFDELGPPANAPPTGNPQSLTLSEDGSLPIVLTGEDSDPEVVQTLNYAIVTSPAHGTLTGFNASTGAVTYVPDPNYNGPDSFRFTVTDDNTAGGPAATSVSVLISLSITAVNDRPVANAQSLINDGTAKVITLTGSDGDPEVSQTLTFAIVTPPTHGTLTGFNAATGTVTYTPTGGFLGPDSFTFTVTDDSTTGGSALTSLPATVTLIATAVNLPPVATPMTIARYGYSIPINLGGDDGNVDLNQNLTFTITSQPRYGHLAFFDPVNGTVNYYADIDGVEDSFAYTVTDDDSAGTPALTSAPVTVSLTTDYANRPSALISADLNGDGFADLVTVNSDASCVSVLLGRGDGTFDFHQDYQTGTYPLSVVSGDFNGDGIVDLATANQWDYTVGILLGRGDGTFELSLDFATGENPSVISAGDFNNDGKLDLVTANYTPGLNILLGNGDGTFQPYQEISTAGQNLFGDLTEGNAAQWTAFAPINDVATVSDDSSTVLLGSQSLHFVTSSGSDTGVRLAAPGGAWDLSSVHFLQFSALGINNTPTSWQGYQPIIVLTSPAGMLRLEPNQQMMSNGSWTTVTVPFAGDAIWQATVTGTFDITDVTALEIHQDTWESSFEVYYDGVQFFDPPSLPRDIAVADVNGDTKLDLIVANSPSGPGQIGVFLGNGDGTFQTERFMGGFSSAAGYIEADVVKVADVNEDTKLDLLSITSNSQVQVLLGNGDGSFVVGALSPVVGERLTLADVNLDGKIDVITSDSSGTQVDVQLGIGNGTFQPPLSFTTGDRPYGLTTADVNGDEKPDIITANYASNNVSVLLRGSGGFQPHLDTTLGAGNYPPVAYAATRTTLVNESIGIPLDGDGGEIYRAQNLTVTIVQGPAHGTLSDFNQVLRSVVYTPDPGYLGEDSFTFTVTDDSSAGGPARTSAPARISLAILAKGYNSQPMVVKIADLNSDGLDDLVTVSHPDKLAVSLAQPGGGFLPWQTYNVGELPNALLIQDINGDSKPDLLVCSYGSNLISVLLGNGDGTFQSRQDYPTDQSPTSIRLADVNSDSKLDLIVAIPNTFQVDILIGNGNGTFQPFQSLSVASSPKDLVVVDVNGDSKLDLITCNFYDYTVSVMLGNGNGTFQASQDYATGDAPSHIAVVDMNHDGRPDILTTNNYVNSVSILLGNADGTFQNRQDFGGLYGPNALAVADFNRDGNPDVVVANAYVNAVSVFFGNGNGTLQDAQLIYEHGSPSWVAVGDLNGDSFPDVAATNFSLFEVSVLTNQGNGNLTETTILPLGDSNLPPLVANADYTLSENDPARRITLFGDDGNPRATQSLTFVIATQPGHGKLTDFDPRTGVVNYTPDLNYDGVDVFQYYILDDRSIDGIRLQSSSATITLTITPTAGNNAPVDVAVGDLNGDSKADLVTANSSGNNLSVLLANGDSTYQAKLDLTTGNDPRAVVIADINKDGKPDLLTANYGSGTVSILFGNGNGTFQAKQDVNMGDSPNKLVVIDLNGDGNLDLVTTNPDPFSHTVSVRLGNGNGTFQTIRAFVTDVDPQGLAVADVDADGTLDIVTANFAGGTVSVLLGNSNGTFRGRVDFATPTATRTIAIADTNLDGKLDLVTVDSGTGGGGILLGNGDGTFQAGTFVQNVGSRPVLIDVNGDGKVDLVSSGSIEDGQMVIVRLGWGNGRFRDPVYYPFGNQRRPLFNIAQLQSVAVADVNGDGKLDLVIASPDDQAVSVLLGNGDGTFGSASVNSVADAPSNHAPIAVSQSIVTNQNTQASIDLSLAAYDPDPGNTLTFAILSGATHGSVVMIGSTATYTPDPNFVGTDTYQFLVTDSGGASSSAVVTVTVNPVSGGLSAQFIQLIGQQLLGSQDLSVPNLPAGWIATGSVPWITVANDSASGANHAFIPDTNSATDSSLISPVIVVSLINPHLQFQNRYETEAGVDGGVLEVAVNGGAYVDIQTAGATFVTGGYNQTISTGNRSAWSGQSSGYVLTQIDLPDYPLGTTLQFRWRFLSNSTIGLTGWSIDSIALTGLPTAWTSTSPVNGASPPASYPLTVSPGTTISGLDFGNYANQGIIRGREFLDANGNGVWDGGGEPVLPGWQVYLDVNGNGQLDQGEPQTVTTTDGTYEFVDVPAQLAQRVVAVLPAGWQPTTFPSNFTTAAVNNPQDGLNLADIAANRRTGFVVNSAGDINGDGIDDLLISSPVVGNETSTVATSTSVVYVVFGRATGLPANFSLSTLDGSNGFQIISADSTTNSNASGASVASAGDINQDGYNDLLIGAPLSDTNGPHSGAVYVIYGKPSGYSATLDLTRPNALPLDGSNGFVTYGIGDNDLLGSAVSGVGDVNHDGISDFVIAAPGANSAQAAGAAYLIFGRSAGQPFPAVFSLTTLNGTNGVRLDGAAADNLGNLIATPGLAAGGSSIAAAGDVNGDGIADLILGAKTGLVPIGGSNTERRGKAYVVFGQASGWTSTLNLGSLAGTNGFVIYGAAKDDELGISVAGVGDFNGDQIADIIVGADHADPHGANSGASYIIFGRTGTQNPFGASLSVASLNGTTGFRLSGSNASDAAGVSVAGAGDVNGDGLSDVVIGANHFSANQTTLTDVGAVYVVFGTRTALPANLDLSNLDGLTGYRLTGVTRNGEIGISVAAGDFNGDGLADVLVGNSTLSSGTDTGTGTPLYPGTVFLVHGRADNQRTVTLDAGELRSNIDFPSRPQLSSITGIVFDDKNANGVQDPGEPGVGGVTLFLDLNNNDADDNGEPMAETDPNGRYVFNNVSGFTDLGHPTATYRVVEQLSIDRLGLQQTFPQFVTPGVDVTPFAANTSLKTGYSISTDGRGGFLLTGTEGTSSGFDQQDVMLLSADGQQLLPFAAADHPQGVTSDGTYAYWIDLNADGTHTRIYRELLAGGPRELIYSAYTQVSNPGQIISATGLDFVDGGTGTLVVLDSFNSQLLSLPVQTGVIDAQVTALGAPRSSGQLSKAHAQFLSVANGVIYLVDPGYTAPDGNTAEDLPARILSIPLAGGAATVLYAGNLPAFTFAGATLAASAPRGIAVQNGTLYVAGETAVYTLPVTGGTPTVLAADERFRTLADLTWSDGSLYVLDNGTSGGATVWRVNLTPPFDRTVNFDTSSNDRSWTVTVGPGDAVTGIDFARSDTAAIGASGSQSIRGTVFSDLNGNGIQDPGEPGISSVTVFLDLNRNGSLDAGDLTAATLAGDISGTPRVELVGEYSFSNLSPGLYDVLLADPSRSAALTTGHDISLVVTDLITGTEGSTGTPRAVAMGDWSGDGLTDLTIADSETGKVSLWQMSGNQLFQRINELNVGGIPNSVTLINLDAGALPDLAIGQAQFGSISLWKNLGNGQFQLRKNAQGVAQSLVLSSPGQTDYGVPGEVVAADLNHDGLTDLIVVDSHPDHPRVFVFIRTSADFKFAAPQILTTPATIKGLVAADLNGDESPDLAMTVPGLDELLIWSNRNDGSGQLNTTPLIVPVGDGPTAVAALQADGTGGLDLAVANTAAGTISILANQGGGTWSNYAILALTAQPTALQAADLDGVNGPDLIVTLGDGNDSSLPLVVFFHSADNSTPYFQSVAYGASIFDFSGVKTASGLAFAVGNLSPAGRPDIVVVNSSAKTVSVLHNLPARPGVTVRLTASGTSANATGIDFGVGGSSDVVWNPTTGQLTITLPVGTDLVIGHVGSKLQVRIQGIVDGLLDVDISAVASILIQGSDETDRIDLSAVTAAAGFTHVGGVSVTVYGNGGDDSITGSGFGDRLEGGDGHDLLDGRDGDDPLIGGIGNDYLFGGNGDDYLDGQSGSNRMEGGPGNNTILGGRVNNAPSFVAGPPPQIDEDSGPVTIPTWATLITPGPDDAGQTVNFTVTNDNNGLFAVQPSLSANGTLTFTPTPNANGVATLTIALHDTGGTANGGVDTSESQLVVITVTAVNDLPIALPQSVAVNLGASLVINLTGDDRDPEVNQVLTYAIAGNPAHGTLSNFDPATGQVTYTPAGNYAGNDTFTITVTDDSAAGGTPLTSLAATVTVVIGSSNAIPIANPVAPVTAEGTALTLTLTGDDSNPEVVQTLTFAIATSPAHGTLSSFNDATGQVTYTPNPNYNGPDSFTFTVIDDASAGGTALTSSPATVSLTVTAVNVRPIASSATVGASANTGLIITLNGEDGDPEVVQALTFAIVSGPSHGTLTNLNSATGQVTYTPTAGYIGVDSFIFTITDDASAGGQALTSQPATINLNVTGANLTPIANPLTTSTAEGTAVELVLTGDDGDPAFNQVLTFAIVAPPAHGSLSGFNPATGQVTYTPNPDYNGTDSFTFTVTDDATAGGAARTSNAATISLTVNPVNAVPVTHSQSLTAADGAAVNVLLTSDDGDPEVVQTMTYAIASNPAHGTLSNFNSATGHVTYTPNPGYNGSDSFTFTVQDDATAGGTSLTSPPATISFTVSSSSGPQLTLGGPAVTWVKKQQPVTVMPGVSVTAFTSLQNGTLTIAMTAIGKKKMLDLLSLPGTSSIGTTSGLKFADRMATLVIQLGANATPAAIESFLRGIKFSTKGKGLKAATRNFSVTLATDGNTPATITQTINVSLR